MRGRTCTALTFLLLFFALGGEGTAAQAQEVAAEQAGWNPLLKHHGLTFSYVFYREADNHHNGVVIMITNTNDYAIQYRFRVVFRSGKEEKVRDVTGELQAGERKTGSSAGLFWIPFLDGRPITEIGLRNYHVEQRR